MSTPVEQIKERLDIVEVLGSYLKLEKAGQNYKARCPFHNEKTPSFLVSPSRQSFYCFGCEAHGDIFSFLERFEGLDFRGALKSLADRAGVKLGDYNPKQQEKNEKNFAILEKVASFFENNLKVNSKAASYLEARGISENSIAKWRLGFSKNEWREAHDFLLNEGFSREEMLQTGLIKKADPSTGPGEEKYYDTFRNRIMFPIFDRAGRVIAFSGRILEENEKAPKYLNSPETEVFKKSEVLYGLNIASQAIRKLDYAVLVEGQIDLVLSHQAGVANSVASSGTALTDIHLRTLQKISNRIILSYDADAAGSKAGKRAAALAIGLGMEVKVVSLPPGEDPASVVKNSPENWKEAIKNAKDAIILTLEEIQKENPDQLALAKKVNTEIIPLLNLLENDIIKSQYVSLINKKTGIPEAALSSEIAKIRAKNNDLSGLDQGAPRSTIESITLSPEEMLVGIILLKKNEAKDEGNIKKKFEDLLGKEFLREIAENGRFDRETLIFETERIMGEADVSLVAVELLERIEKNRLKKRFEELARLLDVNDSLETRKEMMEINQKLSKFA